MRNDTRLLIDDITAVLKTGQIRGGREGIELGSDAMRNSLNLIDGMIKLLETVPEIRADIIAFVQLHARYLELRMEADELKALMPVFREHETEMKAQSIEYVEFMAKSPEDMTGRELLRLVYLVLKKEEKQ